MTFITTIDDIRTAILNSGLNEWITDKQREEFINYVWHNHAYGSNVCLASMYKAYVGLCKDDLMTYNKDTFITKCYRLMAQYTTESRTMIDTIQDIIDMTNAGTVTNSNIKWINELYEAAK